MNCPFCGTIMESGRIDTNAVFHIVRHSADIIFEPDNCFDKRKVSSAFSKREGWYCESCKKIVGIFDVRR